MAEQSRHFIISASVCLMEDAGQSQLFSEVTPTFESLVNNNNHLYIISHDNARLMQLQSMIINQFNIQFVTRGPPIRAIIENLLNEKHSIIVIGAVDEDLILAVNHKLLCVKAQWAIKPDQENTKKIIKYGNPVPSIGMVPEIAQLLAAQRTPLLHLGWPSDTDTEPVDLEANPNFQCKYQVIALSTANEYNTDAAAVEVIQQYRAVLKRDSSQWRLLFRFYLLSFLVNHRELFRDKKAPIWCAMPSSKKSERIDGKLRAGSSVMEELKEMCRFMFGGRLDESVLLREQTIDKNHYRLQEDRECIGAAGSINFPNLFVNPFYMTTLQNRTIILLDDYTTKGNSYEAARTLLAKAGAKRIILISLGKFGSFHKRQIFNVEGDIYTTSYQHELISDNRIDIRSKIKQNAVDEFRKLRDYVALKSDNFNSA